MTILPALLVLLLVIGAATWMSRRWSFASEGRRPGRRHWVTRVVCGTLGAAIVVALAVVTIRDARRPYDGPGNLQVRLPSLAGPEGPVENKAVKKGRFLLHVAIVSWNGGAMVPMFVRTYDVVWPRDRDRSYQETFESGGVKTTYQVSLSEIRRYVYKDEIRLDAEGGRNVWVRSSSFSSNRSGGLQLPEAHGLRTNDGFEWFSMARVPSDAGAMLLDFTPVREDDPLRTGSFEEFLAIRGGSVWNGLVGSAVLGYGDSNPSGSPAEALVKVLQGNLLLLLAAAILLAQLFRRRSLGFVKVAACLLLYVGALDRLVLRIHESRVNDAAAPVEQRLLACAQLPSTAFFRTTAQRDCETIAADPAAPAALKALAGRLAERGRRNPFP